MHSEVNKILMYSSDRGALVSLFFTLSSPPQRPFHFPFSFMQPRYTHIFQHRVTTTERQYTITFLEVRRIVVDTRDPLSPRAPGLFTPLTAMEL